MHTVLYMLYMLHNLHIFNDTIIPHEWCIYIKIFLSNINFFNDKENWIFLYVDNVISVVMVGFFVYNFVLYLHVFIRL